MNNNNSFRPKRPVAESTYTETGQNIPSIGKPLHAIYVCSPYRATCKDEKAAETQLRQNVRRAQQASKLVIRMGYMPMTPHLYFPVLLDDNVKAERDKGIEFGLQWLEQCDELWAFGEIISEGMSAEISRAKALGIPVRMMPEPETLVEKIINHFRGKEFKAYGRTE